MNFFVIFNLSSNDKKLNLILWILSKSIGSIKLTSLYENINKHLDKSKSIPLKYLS